MYENIGRHTKNTQAFKNIVCIDIHDAMTFKNCFKFLIKPIEICCYFHPTAREPLHICQHFGEKIKKKPFYGLLYKNHPNHSA